MDMPLVPYPLGSSSLSTLAPSSSSSSSDQRTELLSTSSIKPISGGSETVAPGVSSSSSMTSSVRHPEPAQTNKDDSASIEAKTST